MEIINPEQPKKVRDDGLCTRNIFIGAVLVAVGVLWLLKNFDFINSHAFNMIFSWRSLMIVIGGFLITQGKRTSGAIIASVGIIALSLELMNIYIPSYIIGKIIFPMIFIVIGAVLLLSKKIRQQ